MLRDPVSGSGTGPLPQGLSEHLLYGGKTVPASLLPPVLCPHLLPQERPTLSTAQLYWTKEGPRNQSLPLQGCPCPCPCGALLRVQWAHRDALMCCCGRKWSIWEAPALCRRGGRKKMGSENGLRRVPLCCQSLHLPVLGVPSTASSNCQGPGIEGGCQRCQTTGAAARTVREG